MRIDTWSQEDSMGYLAGSIAGPHSAQEELKLGDLNSSPRAQAGVWRDRAPALCDSRMTPLSPAQSSLPTLESGTLRLGWGS